MWSGPVMPAKSNETLSTTSYVSIHATSQNPRRVQVGRDPWRPPGPTPCSSRATQSRLPRWLLKIPILSVLCFTSLHKWPNGNANLLVGGAYLRTLLRHCWETAETHNGTVYISSNSYFPLTPHKLAMMQDDLKRIMPPQHGKSKHHLPSS